MQPGETYHFYNHANGAENLFVEDKNYWHFLGKLDLHVAPVADIHSYALMPNHFHLVGKIKSEEDILANLGFVNGLTSSQIEKKISKCFSNLFSSYTQSFNKLYQRMGSLFIPNMKRKLIEEDAAFCSVVHYVHANPVQHGFVRQIGDWPYTSYSLLVSDGPCFINREYVLNKFGGLKRFIEYHSRPIKLKR